MVMLIFFNTCSWKVLILNKSSHQKFYIYIFFFFGIACRLKRHSQKTQWEGRHFKLTAQIWGEGAGGRKSKRHIPIWPFVTLSDILSVSLWHDHVLLVTLSTVHWHSINVSFDREVVSADEKRKNLVDFVIFLRW